jgi:hypothetical protein
MTDIQQFIDALFDPYPNEPPLYLEIRPAYPEWKKVVLYPNGDAPKTWPFCTGQRRFFPLTTEGCRRAVRHALCMSECLETFLGVLPRNNPNKGRQEDVPAAGVLWTDVDAGNGTPEDCIRQVLTAVRAGRVPAPDMVVRSGGGGHFYWRLREPVSLPDKAERDEFKRLLGRIVKAIGGEAPGVHADASRADVASILRPPDTQNWKREAQPRPVTVIHFSPNATPYTYADWLDFLPEPKPKPKPARPFTHNERGYRRLLVWASEGYREGKRHKDLCSAAAWLIRDCHVSTSVAEELLLRKAQNSPGLREITEEEVRGMIRWAAR